ncbi:hypothetical protein DY000_02039764 [Brassica cretica]|uniref:DUF630 domain-containing protein n=1 Tax=Brassica cretica TaxID=69181 RepID=A0ABQ7BNY6_BRACR|nr:hypothetical protein DY000_02039764 [Brassica cretica]
MISCVAGSPVKPPVDRVDSAELPASHRRRRRTTTGGGPAAARRWPGYSKAVVRWWSDGGAVAVRRWSDGAVAVQQRRRFLAAARAKLLTARAASSGLRLQRGRCLRFRLDERNTMVSLDARDSQRLGRYG